MTPIILWDIDQTLIRTGGAGSAAMDITFEEIYGVGDGFGRVEFSGRTDYAIFSDALDHCGLNKGDFEAQLRTFRAVYVGHLARLLTERDGLILPGVEQLIATLAERHAAQGVATGNFAEGARLKLETFGFDRVLRGGGYGDATPVRAEVVAEGARSVRQAHGVNGASLVFVIGDTPMDVEAARANGFVCIAVATGRYNADVLRACGADHVFPDLSDVEEVLGILDGQSN